MAVASDSPAWPILKTRFVSGLLLVNSKANRIAAIAATVGHAGTMIAAAKYGMKEMEPIADCGSAKLSMSAAIANVARTAMAVQEPAGTSGCQKYSATDAAAAATTTPPTHHRVAVRIKD